MTNDRWYKRLGWFIFYSAIALVIFYVLDLVFVKISDNYQKNTFTASFDESTYEVSKNDQLVLKIVTDAKSFTADLWLDEMDLNLTFTDQTTWIIDLSEQDIIPGTYKLKSTIKGKKGLRESEVLIVTTLIIK